MFSDLFSIVPNPIGVMAYWGGGIGVAGTIHHLFMVRRGKKLPWFCWIGPFLAGAIVGGLLTLL